MKQTIALLATWFAAAPPLSAECVASQQYGAGTSTGVSLYAGAGWDASHPLPPYAISSAVSMWKNSCFGMQGRDFPALSEGTDGTVSISVNRDPGNNPASGGGCALFQENLDEGRAVIGGQINIYAKTNAGADCLWVMPAATLDNLIAHELGHVLGLANVHGTECNSYIMSDNWPSASIHADECEFVDEAWEMPNEPPDVPPDGTTCPQAQSSCDPSPIIISLDGPYRLTSPENGVRFDLDADGIADRVAWTDADSGLAFLVLDRNGNGRVDNGAELFGDSTRLSNGAKAQNGFIALAELDATQDGSVDASDSAWSNLQLWFDLDHDGRSSQDELLPIADTAVVAIGTEYQWAGRKDRFGNTLRYKGQITLQHGSRSCYDVYLKTLH
jgi:hypothetical protein